MADNAADLTLRLIDEASGPAKRIASSLGDVSSALKQAGTGGGGLTAAITKGNILAEVLQGVGAMALRAGAAVIRLGFEAARSFTEAVVQAAAFVEKTELAFKMLMKGSGDAGAQLRRVTELAAKLGLPVQETAKSFQKLLAMQFKPAQAEDLIKMTADLQMAGAGAEETRRVLLALSQIKATGKLQGDELLQLADAGVSVDLVYQQLSKTLGKSRDEILKMQAAGKITADQAIAAIGEAVKTKLGIKQFGEAGEKFATSTLTGMVNVFKARGELLLLDIGQRIVKPLQAAVGPIIRDLAAALNSPEFKAGVDGVVAGFTWILGAAKSAWPAVKEFAAGLITGFKQAWSALAPVFEGFKKAFGDQEVDWKKVGEAAGMVAQFLGHFVVNALAAVAVLATIGVGIARAVVWFTELPGKIGEAAFAIGAKALELGTSIIDGLVNGITSGAERVIAAVKGVASSAIATAKSALGIGSPSKVFAELGMWSAEGFAGGMDAGAGDVRTASSQMTGAALGGVAGPSGGAASVGNITVNVSLEGGSGSSAQELGEAFASKLRRELTAIFDGMEPA